MIRAYNEATVLSSSELLLIVACKNEFLQAMGSGCGSVNRVVPTNNRDPHFNLKIVRSLGTIF